LRRPRPVLACAPFPSPLQSTIRGPTGPCPPLEGPGDGAVTSPCAGAEVLGDAITSRVTRLLVFPPLAAAPGRSIVELELERVVAPRPRGARRHGEQKTVYIAVATSVAQLITS